MIPMISFILSNQLYHLFLKVLAVRCIIYALFTKMNILVQLCTWMIKQAKLEHLVCNSVVRHWFRSHQIRAAKLVSHGLNVSNLNLCLQDTWNEASSLVEIVFVIMDSFSTTAVWNIVKRVLLWARGDD